MNTSNLNLLAIDDVFYYNLDKIGVYNPQTKEYDFLEVVSMNGDLVCYVKEIHGECFEGSMIDFKALAQSFVEVGIPECVFVVSPEVYN